MSRSPCTDDLYAITTPQDPAIAPGGDRVVFAVSTANREEDRQETALWWVPTGGGQPARLTSGPADSAPVFSPDGAQLSFLRAQDGPAQIWLLPSAGGEPRQLTSLPWGAGAPRWSPDGQHLAFAAPVDPTGLSPQARAAAPMVSDDLGYQADGAGLIGGLRQQVQVVEVSSGEVRHLTDSAEHVTDPVWRPDGSQLAFATASGEDPDLTLRSTAHMVDVDSPGSARALPASGLGLELPIAFDATGERLLCAGADKPGYGHTRAWSRSLDDSALTDLSGALDRNVMVGGPGYPGAEPTFVDGGAVALCVRDKGYSNLYRIDPDGEAVALVAGATTVAGMSVTADRTRAAVAIKTPHTFGEIALVDLTSGELTELTSYRESWADTVSWMTPQERTFTAPDGRPVHGWLLRGDEVHGPTPLLLDIHGGPHNAWSGGLDAEHLYHQVLAAAGWTVLLLNPRGSDGYGEDFYNAAVGDWGLADADDFLAPLDELVAEGVADPDRLAVTGYSYGGYMTCYLTSRDRRFAAAVPGGIVANSTSIAGTSDMGYFLATQEMGGSPWAEPERLAERSPMQLVEQVDTPTLILHGAADVRCPVGEAKQWFTALRSRGVPSRLVLYPDASHLFILNGRPSHRVDYNRRIVDWVHRHTAAAAAGRPAVPALEAEHWQHRLSELITRHEVPGATLGILRLGAAPDGSDETVTAAAGTLNLDTGHPVTAESVFQIGSITKVWTATLVMQLVDEGLIELDTPVRAVLPELRLADEEVGQQVTVRHLLTHTSGIDGDIFTDTGRGDDCLEKYVSLLAEARQIHPLGATFSYCNSGFNLLGRVIEKVTGKVWDAALRERIVQPLGLERTTTLPEEALRFGAALGHTRGDDQTLTPAARWGIPRSSGPAGLITAQVRDVLEFAAMHLRGGTGADGTRVLTEAAAEAMQVEQVRVPGRYDLGDSWGLGWIRFDWAGERLFGHDGNTIGQSAFLRILPRDGLVVVLLTNGGNTPDLFRSLYGEVFRELSDVHLPERLAPTEVDVNLSEFTSTYERAAERIEVLEVDGVPTLRSTALQPLHDDGDPTRTFQLHGFEPDTCLIRPPELDTWSPVTFYRLPSGKRYLHHHLRATPEEV